MIFAKKANKFCGSKFSIRVKKLLQQIFWFERSFFLSPCKKKITNAEIFFPKKISAGPKKFFLQRNIFSSETMSSPKKFLDPIGSTHENFFETLGSKKIWREIFFDEARATRGKKKFINFFYRRLKKKIGTNVVFFFFHKEEKKFFDTNEWRKFFLACGKFFLCRKKKKIRFFRSKNDFFLK